MGPIKTLPALLERVRSLCSGDIIVSAYSAGRYSIFSRRTNKLATGVEDFVSYRLLMEINFFGDTDEDLPQPPKVGDRRKAEYRRGRGAGK
jgi:hypothetical protein